MNGEHDWHFYVGLSGNCLPEPRPCPHMWHETLFEELRASAYMCKKMRSETFKICQDVFPVRALPGPRWLTTLPDPLVGRRGNTPSHILSHSVPRFSRLRVLPLGASILWGFAPNVLSKTTPISSACGSSVQVVKINCFCSYKRRSECFGTRTM